MEMDVWDEKYVDVKRRSLFIYFSETELKH